MDENSNYDREDTYGFWAGLIAEQAGQRVRLTFRSGYQVTGMAAVKRYGIHDDVQIDGHGGQQYEAVVKVERMGLNRRYEVIHA